MVSPGNDVPGPARPGMAECHQPAVDAFGREFKKVVAAAKCADLVQRLGGDALILPVAIEKGTAYQQIVVRRVFVLVEANRNAPTHLAIHFAPEGLVHPVPIVLMEVEHGDAATDIDPDR